jgi:hypothetical protein
MDVRAGTPHHAQEGRMKRYGKTWRIVPCIAFALLLRPAAAADSADREAVQAAITAIRNVVREPDSIASLLSRQLQLSDCYPLTSGPQSCSYRAAELDEDWPVALTSLYVLSTRRFGDSGGTAFWQLRPGLCISVEEADLPAGVRRELAAPLVDFFAGSEIDTAVQRRFVLANLNPGWGKVDLTVDTRDNCIGSLTLELARRRD